MPTVPLDTLEARVGTTKRTTSGLTVEAGKVAEFAEAIHNDDPVYRDESVAADRGLDGIPAPLSFLRTSYFPRYRPEGIGISLVDIFDFGFDQRYLVHGEHEYEFERPVYVGDTLSATSEFVDVTQREGRDGDTMTFAVVETTYRDADDDPVVTERATFIETRDPDDAPDGTDAGGGRDEEGGTDA